MCAQINHVSPLAPASFPKLPVIGGVRFSAVEANVKYQGRNDVMLVELQSGSSVAGVFTRSKTRSAPVLWCESLRDGPAAEGKQYILVNSGNSNAFTGRAGINSVERCVEAVMNVTGCAKNAVWLASTGVIGEQLPDHRITDNLPELVTGLDEKRIEDAARAFMTTDTFAKGASAEIELDGMPVKIAGIAKGSGMIAPDMATMLSYVFTDAAVERELLQKTLKDCIDISFNAITVDSDTSTSDSVQLAATGAANIPAITRETDPRYAPFKAALAKVLTELAHLVVKDGEGATKFVEVTVTGAENDKAAKRVAKAIADSPLVKTALAGEDPNWGRIVMAVGKSGEMADRDALKIRFGDILVAKEGQVAAEYREEDGAAYMKAAELAITTDLGIGEGRATVWTCDLTHGYITINADYRS